MVKTIYSEPVALWCVTGERKVKTLQLFMNTKVTHPPRCTCKSRILLTWAWWGAIPIPAAQQRRADSQWWPSRPSTSAWRTLRPGSEAWCSERNSRHRGEKKQWDTDGERERERGANWKRRASLPDWHSGWRITDHLSAKRKAQKQGGGFIVSLSLKLLYCRTCRFSFY